MMRRLTTFCLASAVWLGVAGPLPAQGPGGYRTYGSASGFGNILFPGTGNAPNINATGPGRPYGSGRGYQSISGYPRGRTVVVPYAVPVYFGSYGGWGSYYTPQDPNVTIVQQAPPQQPSPAVIINQYYTPDNPQPVLREYPPGSLPEPGELADRKAEPAARPSTPEDKPTVYLIAFKSGTIYPALAYWVEEDTLHYITMDKSLNKASLSLIDRELSARFNSERNVEFKLPAK